MHTFKPRRPAGRRLLAACVLAALAPEAMAYPTEEMSSIPIQTQVMWQLTEKRVSASENGSFQAFLQETRWRRVVLSGGLLGGK